ncbi:MAG: methyl-accepting chemotaxis protein [Candidatus Cloacimonetes bacterium]|nr:methyl-accepting chemotaxis protein [Candidatus Cloacimonadota bacterium]
MRKLITNNETACVGCNRCIRACPIIGANRVSKKGHLINVSVDTDRCIACGACIHTCRHNVRNFVDDTEQFLYDLRMGAKISMLVAPANRIIEEEGGRLLTWLRQQGVRNIYDVSVGADICTWAHIRAIENVNHPLITQPCPVIVNFIQMYAHDLLKYLSPIHSPMLCTAIFMKKYCDIHDNLAALSPCIAKAHEFDATNYVKYNVTLEKLFQHIEENNIRLPDTISGFDHQDSALGLLYPMPGGLKENIEYFFGKQLRIDQSEGSDYVYDALKEFAKEDNINLPDIFDVLNCHEGCNVGTAIKHDQNRFRVSTIMDEGRKNVFNDLDREQYEQLFNDYDNILRLDDFIRKYNRIDTKKYAYSDNELEQAFLELNKKSEDERLFDCGACGSDSCKEMASKIAMGIDLPDNCIKKLRDDVLYDHRFIVDIATSNIENLNHVIEDISDIKNKSDEIQRSLITLNEAIKKFKNITTDIDTISTHINLIALNASIAAAKAGQHGSTFSVVADEIRNLANKSKLTVAESETLVTESTNSISTINSRTNDICTDIDDAHVSISSIHKSLNETIEKTKKWED